MAVVVAQLVGQLLPTTEIGSFNPVIGKFYNICTKVKNFSKKTKIKKRDREWPF